MPCLFVPDAGPAQVILDDRRGRRRSCSIRRRDPNGLITARKSARHGLYRHSTVAASSDGAAKRDDRSWIAQA